MVGISTPVERENTNDATKTGSGDWHPSLPDLNLRDDQRRWRANRSLPHRRPLESDSSSPQLSAQPSPLRPQFQKVGQLRQKAGGVNPRTPLQRNEDLTTSVPYISSQEDLLRMGIHHHQPKELWLHEITRALHPGHKKRPGAVGSRTAMR